MNLICTRGAAYEYADPESGKQFFSWSQLSRVLDPYAFVGIPRDVLAAAQQRGIDVHFLFAIEMFHRLGLCPQVHGHEDPEIRALAARYPGYLDGIRDFADTYQITPLRIEESSCVPRFGIAGTADLKCLYGPRQIVTLLDLKTGAKRKVDPVQLNVYGRFHGHEDCKHYLDFYLQADGSYKLEPAEKDETDWAWALSAIPVLQGQLSHNITVSL